MTSSPTTERAAGRQVEVAVSGMTCAACAARVERKLNRVDGLTADVNYATGKAVVTAPPQVSGRSSASVMPTYSARPMSCRYECSGPTPG